MRDIIESLKPAAANVRGVGQLPHALKLAADTDLSAAVVDYKIGDAGSAKLCWLLKERRISFLFYGGLDFVRRQRPDAMVIEKPAIHCPAVSDPSVGSVGNCEADWS